MGFDFDSDEMKLKIEYTVIYNEIVELFESNLEGTKVSLGFSLLSGTRDAMIMQSTRCEMVARACICRSLCSSPTLCCGIRAFHAVNIVHRLPGLDHDEFYRLVCKAYETDRESSIVVCSEILVGHR